MKSFALNLLNKTDLQLISLSNETNINQKCLKIAFNLLCDTISNNMSDHIRDQSINCINSFVKTFEDSTEEELTENIAFLEKGG